MNREPIAIDLFAGAGGLSHGLCRSGWRIPLAVEIDRDSAASYSLNHSETKVLRSDISTVDFRFECERLDIPDGVDLVCGGPPCQGFSTVGSKRFSDPRNSLFGQFLRAVDELSPKMVLFENVSGFQTMYGGQIHDLLLSEFGRRGYTVTSKIVDPVFYGLPQYRRRCIVIGSGVGCPISPPPPTHGERNLLDDLSPLLTVEDAISDLPELGPAESVSEYTTRPLTDYQRQMRGNCTVLTEHNAANYGDRMQQVIRSVPPGGSILDLPEYMRPKGYFANTYARLWSDRPAPTITRNLGTPSSSRCIHPTQHRALSTREGARLQGFYDNYQFIGGKGSKNLQIGNAVPPLLGEVLGRALRDAIVGTSPKPRPRQGQLSGVS